MEQLYKLLGPDGQAWNGGVGKWHLPRNGKPGAWMPRLRGKLIACHYGYHLCRAQDMIHWLAPTIYMVEVPRYAQTDALYESDKVVVRGARLVAKLDTWDDRTARLFAADCAEHVLWIWYAVYPDDDQPAATIRAARKFAAGEITPEELAAAGAAAWDAGIAARAAAKYAAWAVGDAARAAAKYAAWAVGDAARDTAGDAEHGWQTRRLLSYLALKTDDA